MLKEADLNIRLGIMSGLGQSNSAKAIEFIKPFLADTEPLLKQQAVFSLGQIDRPEVMPLIKPLVFDKLPEIRSAVAAVYGAKATPDLIEPIRNLIKDESPLVRQQAIISFAQIPDAPLVEIAPFLNDKIPEIKLAAIQATSPKVGIEPIISQSFMKLAREDISIPVRAAATMHLDKIRVPEIANIVENNFRSDNLLLRQSAINVAGRIDLPQMIPILSQAASDPHSFTRSSALYGLGNKISQSPMVVEVIKPYVNDPMPVVRLAAVSSIGSVDKPGIDKLLSSRLTDSSSFVRQVAISNLGLRVHKNQELINPLVDRLKNDADPWSRHLAAFSLKTVQSPQIESVKPLIQQNVPEIKVVVITPGVDDFFPWTPGRDISQDATNNWQLRKIFELGGVKVLEHRWSGKMWELPQVQRSFEQTQLAALKLAGPNGAILNLTHSGGSFVAEPLFNHIRPGINTQITDAINQQRIKMITLNSYSTSDFSKIDHDFKNFSNIADLSFISSFNRIPTGILPLDASLALSNRHNINYVSSPEFHSAFTNPKVIASIIQQTFPNLSMPKLDIMIKQQNTLSWKYFPTHGNWPEIYNFSSIAPPDYYLKQQINSQINTQPVYTPMPVYTPQRGYWPGTYNFNIRAPDDYYLHQQQFSLPEISEPPSMPKINYNK
ncbi:MAG: HEAT repeat domain-containing protein [Candidatus Omnitrophica bacterium]|nr:HEAT repeat domain-containing protein [Candidatus Omnitrophota bacterium]